VYSFGLGGLPPVMSKRTEYKVLLVLVTLFCPGDSAVCGVFTAQMAPL